MRDGPVENEGFGEDDNENPDVEPDLSYVAELLKEVRIAANFMEL